MDKILKVIGIIAVSLSVISCKGVFLGSATLELGVDSSSIFSSYTSWIRVGNSSKAFEMVFYGDETDQKFVLKAGDQDFDKLASIFTNGDNDVFQIGMDLPSGTLTQTINEAYYFFDDRTGESGVDFSGYTIKSIELVIDNVSVVQSLNGTEASFSYTLNVYSNIAKIE